MQGNVHASHWHDDPRFYSPMAVLDSGIRVFIRDCVTCLHPHLNTTVTAQIVKFYNKVAILIQLLLFLIISVYILCRNILMACMLMFMFCSR